MNYSIKTAEKFKLPIAAQSRSWDLGAENVIARMAFAISLEMEEPIAIDQMLDSKGKEYPSKVLFGEYQSVYEGMLSQRESLPPSHPNFKKLVKCHVDRGLDRLLAHSSMDLSQIIDFFSDPERNH